MLLARGTKKLWVIHRDLNTENELTTKHNYLFIMGDPLVETT
jgi:hypothetical protein